MKIVINNTDICTHNYWSCSESFNLIIDTTAVNISPPWLQDSYSFLSVIHGMDKITSAHSMDTAFYAVDENGYLYECFSGEIGAVPEIVDLDLIVPDSIQGRIGYARTVHIVSVEALLHNEIDIYGNSYRYDIVDKSTCKVDNTPLKDLVLPVFYGKSLIISPEDALVYNDLPSEYVITEIVRKLTGNCTYKIKKFKDILDNILEHGIPQNDEENEYVLFWGFKDIAPASLLLAIPEFFTEEVYWVQKSNIPVVYESVRPVVSDFDASLRIEVNKAFKKAIKKFTSQ